ILGLSDHDDFQLFANILIENSFFLYSLVQRIDNKGYIIHITKNMFEFWFVKY
ncbi:hypothetical protein ACJX0J_022716, partial [Zea mays]